jgi:phage shock protein C
MKRYSQKHGRSRCGSRSKRPSDNFNPEDWWERRRQGFGMNLYRNVRKKKIAGVCSGLADHFNVDHWVIRLAAVGGFFFFNMLMVWAYIGAWISMAPRPKGGPVQQKFRYDENLHQDRPVNMFRYQMNPSERLATAKNRLDSIVDRVGKMETYVTSSRYELDKEFSKIDK